MSGTSFWGHFYDKPTFQPLRAGGYEPHLRLGRGAAVCAGGTAAAGLGRKRKCVCHRFAVAGDILGGIPNRDPKAIQTAVRAAQGAASTAWERARSQDDPGAFELI